MKDYPAERLRAAYAECRRLAGRHYENFPVVSYLVPRPQRDALAAIYAFARSADDFADEPGQSRRLEALAEWRERLYACYAGNPSAAHSDLHAQAVSPSSRQTTADAVFIALGHAARQFQLSQVNLENLLCAFELDVRTHRHRDFASLLDYCRYSANPVGRLVLELLGHREPELVALSDAICTALQLTNFWQDVRVDLDRDRVYVPLEDLERFNLAVDDLKDWVAPPQSGNGRERIPGTVSDAARDERWQSLMAFEVARTRQLFERGRPLPEKVGPELRRQLRLTWLGGMAILDKIESARYDVFRYRPKLARRDFLRLYLRARRELAGVAAPAAGATV